MKVYQARLRQLHRMTAPLIVLPLLLTLITGSLYQIVELGGKDDNFKWLLAWHKGHFGRFNLEIIYPFLNALGLLTLVITGTLLWWQTRRKPRKMTE